MIGRKHRLVDHREEAVLLGVEKGICAQAREMQKKGGTGLHRSCSRCMTACTNSMEETPKRRNKWLKVSRRRFSRTTRNGILEKHDAEERVDGQ
mmetsp:Transcript_65342/g.136880  ORF Transcript_65342/g.136880 Transcript_65342/m.136880 type:complete len:94 (-) Transcript_65342:140-421(-)